jgi:hypothetical protein
MPSRQVDARSMHAPCENAMRELSHCDGSHRGAAAVSLGDHQQSGNTSCRGIGRVLADGWLVEGTRMAQPARQQHTLTEQEEQRIAEEAKAIQKQDTEPERQGDVLGLSDASPAVEIPRATDDRSGNPAGIEVRSASLTLSLAV